MQTLSFLAAQGFAADRASRLSAAKLLAEVGICRPQLSSCCCSSSAKSSGARSEELGVQRKANAAEYSVPWWLYGKECVLVGEHRGRQSATLPGACEPLRRVVALGKVPALMLQYRHLSLGVWGAWGGRVCSPL